MKQLQHVAIIMDGNGRWAQSKSRPRFYGHVQGVRTAKKIISHAQKIGVPYLTLYTFSSENWKRPQQEVFLLMKLLEKYLRREKNNLIKNNVRFNVIGQIERLPAHIVYELQDTIQKTKNNTGLSLVMALSYGGREDILSAAKKLAHLHSEGKIKIDQIDSDKFSSYLETQEAPDPDLIIRTSGEKRISNFLLWQSAYSEFFFIDKHWPDFKPSDLDQAIHDFSKRERRYGKTPEQVNLGGLQP